MWPEMEGAQPCPVPAQVLTPGGLTHTLAMCACSLQPVPSNSSLVCTAWLENEPGHKMRAVAELRNEPGGTLYAVGHATLITVAHIQDLGHSGGAGIL